MDCNRWIVGLWILHWEFHFTGTIYFLGHDSFISPFLAGGAYIFLRRPHNLSVVQTRDISHQHRETIQGLCRCYSGHTDDCTPTYRLMSWAPDPGALIRCCPVLYSDVIMHWMQWAIVHKNTLWRKILHLVMTIICKIQSLYYIQTLIVTRFDD